MVPRAPARGKPVAARHLVASSASKASVPKVKAKLSQRELEAKILRGFADGHDRLDRQAAPGVRVVPLQPGATGREDFPRGWSRSQGSKRIARGVAEWFVPNGADTRRRMLFLHGGSYTVYAPQDAPYRSLCSRLAVACRLSILSVDYRMAPEHLFPAAFDDSAAALSYIAEHGPCQAELSPASDVFVCGDSAGGGLALAVCVAPPTHVRRLLRGVVGLSAWADLTASTPSYDTRQWDPERCFGDSASMTDRKGGQQEAEVYLGRGGVARHGRDWRASPFFAPAAMLKTMCPVLLHVGDYELILDESVLLQQRMKDAGHKDATCIVFPRMWHCFHEYSEGGGFGQQLEVACRAVRDIGRWTKAHSS